MLRTVKAGDQNSRVWDFTYPEVLQVFMASARDLELPVVPRQARHSGPSMHFACGGRALVEVQMRGGWQNKKSVARYRLAATWSKIPREVQCACEQAAKSIQDVMLGHGVRHDFLPLPGVQG